MSKIDELFTNLHAVGRKAFMPFITAGDPDLEFTARLLAELVGRGSHLCEVGIPYSDPIADGPVIQASYTRALEKRVRLEQILEMLGGATSKLNAPVVTMTSYAIISRQAEEQYVDSVAEAGVAGIIAPDLPVEEAAPLAKICATRDISLIQLVTPTTPRERTLRIAETSTGFLYYVSVTGITGERKELPEDLGDNVAWLREQTDLPICIGFGISEPEHVRMLAPVADGLIVGSAIVRRIAAARTEPREAVLKDIGNYVSTLLSELSVA
jgi:tryptophan synthase alpha chain